MKFIVAFLVAFTVLGPTSGQAQAADTGQAAQFVLLAIPDTTMPMLCRPVPTAGDTTRATVYEFRFGTPVQSPITTWPREIAIASDTGVVFALSDQVQSFLPSGLVHRTRGAAILVSPDTVAGAFTEIVVDTAAQNRALAEGDIEGGLAAIGQPATRPLTEDEEARAKALAYWLWERRCGRSD
jgi:hypothetical protein